MTTLETLLELAKTEEGLMRIRVMVAELNGYERRPDGQWRRVGEVGTCGLPDYTGSLDAMAPAEVSVLRTDRDTYIQHLKSMRGVHWGFASALERAIAFILTKQST